MTDPAEILRRIREERQACEAHAAGELAPLVLRGDVQQAIDALLFFLPPHQVLSRARLLLDSLGGGRTAMDEAQQLAFLHFCVLLARSLWSFLPRWNLLGDGRWGDACLTQDEVDALADAASGAAIDAAARAPSAAARLLDETRADLARRFTAEGSRDPAGEARAAVGALVEDDLRTFRQAVTSSNLRRIAELRHAGRIPTEISNDYAAFFPWAFYLGASFVTCNPPLVDLAWVADPAAWNPRIDRILGEHAEADADGLARRVTLEIVLDNMRLLRPVFLLTEGRMGCVSLQVNPRRHDDSQSMIEDSLSIFDELTHRLAGGVPNVVFKLPGTRAGLAACRELTRRSIGVTITVNFGLFQHVPFAEAIRDGTAQFSTLAHMSGRLAFPVRDELLDKKDELARSGWDEARLRQAAAWSGVIVLRKLHRLLRARGISPDRVRPLIASLRIYDGPLYAGLPGRVPDITEVLGTGILTVFPNVRRAFDAAGPLDLRPGAIDEPAPAEALEVLRHSEIFRQAYVFGDEDPDRQAFQPAHPLRLEDEAATFAWTPVHNTLTEFIRAYDAFVARIEGRRRIVRLRAWRDGGAPLEAAEIAAALTDPFAATHQEAWQILGEIEPSAPAAEALHMPAVTARLEGATDDAWRQMAARVMQRHTGAQPMPRL